jgi:hypothetical protein
MDIKYADMALYWWRERWWKFYGSRESFIGMKLFCTVFQNISVLKLSHETPTETGLSKSFREKQDKIVSFWTRPFIHPSPSLRSYTNSEIPMPFSHLHLRLEKVYFLSLNYRESSLLVPQLQNRTNKPLNFWNRVDLVPRLFYGVVLLQ